MSSEQSVLAAVRKARGPRQVCIPTPYVQKYGVQTPGTVQKGVLREAYIFLRLDGKGAHFARATQWRQTRILNEPDPYMWFFQLLLLLVESHWHGSARPIADKRYDPQGYRLTVELQARKLAGQATVADNTLLRQMVRDDGYHDLHFDYDVRCELFALQLRAAEELKANAEPAAAAAAGDAEGEQPKKKRQKGKQQRAPVIAMPQVVQIAPAAAAAAAASEGENPLFDAWDPLPQDDARARYAEQEVWAQRKADVELARQPGLAVAAAADTELEQRIRAEVSAKIRPPDPEMQQLVPKVEFSVCYVPSPSGGGMMCRFLFRDPKADPGTFFMGPLLADIRQRIETKLHSAGGNQRGGGGGQHGQPKEHFPHYRSYYAENNHPVSERTNLQTYYKMVTALCPEYIQRHANRADAFPNMRPHLPADPTHPCRLLSLERALKVMADVGCSPLHCDGSQWRNATGQPIVPAEACKLKSMVYMPDAVFWKNLYDVGMSEHFMPHVDADSDFLATVLADEDISRFLPGNEHLQRPPSSASRLYSENWRISRAAVRQQELLKYQTNNEHMHLGARAAIVNKRIAREFPTHAMTTHASVTELGPELWKRRPELVKRAADYDRYCVLNRLAQDASYLAFEALWPLEGDLRDLPVSSPIQAILQWYQEAKLPNLTREFCVYDRKLGFLGNSMLQSLKILACIGRIVHPSICLLSEGLFSCYRYAPRELAFNIMAHGRYDVGKTYILITTLIKLLTINGTVEEYTSESAAASTSENHVYDVIIASDEVPPWKVDADEAKKNPGLVNQEKVKMVTQKVGKKIFTFVKTDEGDKVRWTRLVTSDHYGSLVEVTNWQIEEKNALSSRYHTITVPISRIPVRQLNGDMGSTLTQGARNHFHTLQYLTACAYKAMQDGVLLEPNMKLFDDLNNRIMNYLNGQRAVSADAGNRGLEVMRPYAIQLAVHMAIHYAFDMPWSPNWKKQFEVKHIRELQRYLYCTTEMVWWCWTAMACEWVVENNALMLESAVASLGVRWLPGTSAYAMFERDLRDQIPFRMRPVPNFRGNRQEGNDFLIDLNYLVFEGSVEKVAADIAAASDHRIAAVDVLGVINGLSTGRRITIPGGGMIPQPAAKFKRYHRYRVLPKPGATRDDEETPGFKERGFGDAMRIPEEYMISNQDQNLDRTEKDVPRYDESHRFAPVEISEDGKFVYIMPCVAEQYKTRVIIDALVYATMCKTMRAGKMLLGMPSDKDSMQLQTYNCPSEWISKLVVGLDGAESIYDGKWRHEPNKPNKVGDEIPTSRTKGIAFVRRGVINALDAKFVKSVPLGPVSEAGRAAYLERVGAEVDGLSDVLEVVEDLDYHSARLQHLRSGLALDEPVHDPKWIEERFEQTAMPNSYSELNYPEQWEELTTKHGRIWDSLNDTSAQAKYMNDLHKEEMEAVATVARARAPAAAPAAAPMAPAFVPVSAATDLPTLSAVVAANTALRELENEQSQNNDAAKDDLRRQRKNRGAIVK